MRHELTHWSNKTLPQCKQCSFNIYSKKISPSSMLFKQINNERGDLVFLVASNIRYSFALQTGGRSYSIETIIEGNKVKLNIGTQKALYLTVNEKQKITLGLTTYFIKLQRVNSDNESIDLIIWLG